MWDLGPRLMAAGKRGRGREGGWLPVVVSSNAGGGGGAGEIGIRGGFSHESDYDLDVMVSDFLENGSGGGDSWCSSDSDSGFSDIGSLADKVSVYKHTIAQSEKKLLTVVQSHILSISEKDLYIVKEGLCNTGSCIRQSLVDRLRRSGYDAALCISKWQGFDNIPGGDHEYIDVVVDNGHGILERFIVDLDFRSHFEIARAVESYETILKMLPVVYVGSLIKLKQLLQVMAEAAKFSLKQNSMPLPPWRTLPYLQAKWQSSYDRVLSLDFLLKREFRTQTFYHKQCVGHLRRLKSSVQFEIEKERLLKPVINNKGMMTKSERRRTSLIRV